MTAEEQIALLKAGLAALRLANAIQEARDVGGHDSGFLGTRCVCYG